MRILLLLALTASTVLAAGSDQPWPGFQPAPAFGEQIRWERTDDGVRVYTNLPSRLDAAKPTLVLIYATPNGNTIEQTLGRAIQPGEDWHFDIQHVAAQTRRLREIDTRENIELVCVQAEEKSWPAWRAKYPDNAVRIRALVARALEEAPGSRKGLALTGHSGGGSFLFGYLNGGETVPPVVRRIAFLDANYSYSDADRHGDKLLAWLAGDPQHHLSVIAYDDREITLDGKKVVGPDGGTYRATGRMLEGFRKDSEVTESRTSTLATYTARRGQIQIRVALNPENKILHTALVGEWNGLLQAMTEGTPEEGLWGTFGGPRAYARWIDAAPMAEKGIPTRPTDAPNGHAFLARSVDLPPAEREAALLQEMGRGNLPPFLRQWKTVRVSVRDADGMEHTAEYQVMPDYLAVGDDADWIRFPMTPMTAQRLADTWGCALLTRKMSDDVWKAAEVKLEPRPLTVEREATRTFVQHHAIIEEQRAGKPLGVLVAGIKKDVVITNRLREQPHRVAIYGWHYPDGKPIQPLTIVHRETYVDYSHGVRLARDRMLVDGKPASLRDVLRDPKLCVLVSDEGPIERPYYERSP